MAGTRKDLERQVGIDTVQAERKLVQWGHHRELGAVVRSNRIGEVGVIESAQYPHDRLARSSIQIVQKTLAQARIGPGNGLPVVVDDCVVAWRIEGDQELLHFIGGQALIADRVGQEQSTDPVRVGGSKDGGDRGAHTVANEQEFIYSESITDRQQVIGTGLEGVVSILGQVGLAVASQIERDSAARLPDVSQLVGPVVGIPGQRMHEDCREVALPLIINENPARSCLDEHPCATLRGTWGNGAQVIGGNPGLIEAVPEPLVAYFLSKELPMRLAKAVTPAFLVLLGALSTPGATTAQEGFLFKSPVVTLSLRVGAILPAANDEIHRFFTDTLTLDRKDFASSTYGADVGIRLNNRVDLLVGVTHASVKKQSEFENWVHDNDEPIQQTTLLRRTPLSVGARFFLMDRGRSVGTLAWVPTSFAPYVGAGVGKTWYKLQQEGEFVDHENLDIFLDNLQSSGSTEQLHVFGGAEWWANARIGLTAEARYSWGSAPLSGSYTSFSQIDLRGFQLTAGLATRF